MRLTHRLLAVFVVAVLASACGDDSSPIGPSQIPEVAGTYVGLVTVTGLGEFPNGSGRMVVVQSGSQLTITGSMTLFGYVIHIPAVTGSLNATGFFTADRGGAIVGELEHGTCGTLSSVSSSLAFSGDTARHLETVATTYCGLLQLVAALQR